MSKFLWSTPKLSGSRVHSSMFAVSMSPKSSGRQFSVILYAEGMKLTRWIKGDKVLVGFDLESGLIALRRDVSGYTLCANGGQHKKPKSLRITCTAPKGIKPFARTLIESKDAQMVDDMLVIVMPKVALTRKDESA